jgi:hypothetical protein
MLSTSGQAQDEDRPGLRASILYGYKFEGSEIPMTHDLAYLVHYVFKGGLGIDLEVGTHGGWHWDKECDCYGSFAATGSYYFSPISSAKGLSKFEPFLTAGYEYMSSNLLGNGHSPHLFNVGGGIGYWFKDRAGVRAEFREHLSFSSEKRHFSELRIGVTALLFRQGGGREATRILSLTVPHLRRW